MRVIKSFLACFSIYSRIPMPVVELDSEDMKYVMIFFPFIGSVIGAIEYGLFYLFSINNIPKLVGALLFMAVPIIVTGGIHLDGFMDTVDAFSSFGDREKKLSIMKDPNTGAFAVIRLSLYGILFLAFTYMINDKSILLFCICFFVSRIVCGITVVTIDGAKKEGMIHSVKEKSENKIVFIILMIFAILTLIVLFINNPIIAIIYGLISVISYFIYRRKMIRELSGITGDTSGYFLCVFELLLVVIASVGGLIL